MEIEIIDKKENKLLKRTEVKFKVSYKKEKVPKRNAVLETVAKHFDVKKENVIIDNVKPMFGVSQAEGYAKLYSDVETIKNTEPDFILKRHGLLAAEEKK